MPIERRITSPRLERQLDQISPSLAARAASCPLAVIFSLDSAYAGLRSRGSHFSALGQICHELWEREGRGEFDAVDKESLRDALHVAWSEAERRSVAALRESLGGIEPPPPREWPDYLAKRLGVLRLIKLAVLGRRDPAATSSNGNFRPSVEDPIDIPGVPIHGRPDRVVWSQGTPHIVDLKTCSAEEEMRSEHRRQLLAYAYLWHAQHAVWPATASIQYVGGERHTLDVDPAEAESVAAEMIEALEVLNGQVEATTAETLATPSGEACRWCPFKAACAPFFEDVTPEWGLYDRHIIGRVESIDPAAQQWSVTLTNAGGNLDKDITRVIVVGVPAEHGLQPGDILAVAGARATRSAATVRCGWETVLCIWVSDADLGSGLRSRLRGETYSAPAEPSGNER